MKIRLYLIISIAILCVLGMSACVRQASTTPKEVIVTEPALETEIFPLPGTSDDVMSQLEAFATQTAIAMFGPVVTEQPLITTEEIQAAEGTVEAPVEATPEPSVTTEEVQVIEVPPPTPGLPKTYTLQKGEHPYCIARRFNIDPNEMLRLSGLSGGNSFPTGTELKIPQSGNKFPGNRALKSHPTTYTVVSGDTIYSIACLFGDVSPEEIAYANNLKSPYKLSPGDKLNIP